MPTLASVTTSAPNIGKNEVNCIQRNPAATAPDIAFSINNLIKAFIKYIQNLCSLLSAQSLFAFSAAANITLVTFAAIKVFFKTSVINIPSCNYPPVHLLPLLKISGKSLQKLVFHQILYLRFNCMHIHSEVELYYCIAYLK